MTIQDAKEIVELIALVSVSAFCLVAGGILLSALHEALRK